MCLTEIGTVLEHADGESAVLVDGIERRLPNLLVPDAQPGDLVVIGMGLVLGRALVIDGSPTTGRAPGHAPTRTPTPEPHVETPR